VTWNPSRPPFNGRLVVVGGQCSKVGKTALVVDLIRAFPGLAWTAVKVTPHAGSGCPVNGPGCRCGAEEHAFAIRHERDEAGGADMSRFLAAGARRAMWVETKAGSVEGALSTLASELAQAEAIVIESNAIVEFWHPDLLLMILDPGRPDSKQSAREALDLAHAFVFRFAGNCLVEPAVGGIVTKAEFCSAFGAAASTRHASPCATNDWRTSSYWVGRGSGERF